MSGKRHISDAPNDKKEVKRFKQEPVATLHLYSILANVLSRLPPPIVRIVLSMCDVFLLSNIMTTELLPALSARYAMLPSPQYANQDFMHCLRVGMRLDVLTDDDIWNTGTILRIASHKEHVDGAGHNYQGCQRFCDKCATEYKADEFKDSNYECVLLECDNDFNNDGDIENWEWVSLSPGCANCHQQMNPRLKPFLSAWGNSCDRAKLDVHTYLRLGTCYPRPYLDNCTAWIVQKESEFLHNPIYLRITDNDNGGDVVNQEIDLQSFVRTCSNPRCIGLSSFAAMTCDDNGRIYALTRPCHNLVVFTNDKGSDDYEMVIHSLGDTIACETTDIQSFIMSIVDASMVLSIQQIQQTDDGPKPICTYAFALPLVQATTTALTV